jgi:3-hydroxyacyl-CoA dehydrogenase
LGLSGTQPGSIFTSLATALSKETKLVSAEALVSEYDVDNTVRMSLNWPKGPSALLREATAAPIMKKDDSL